MQAVAEVDFVAVGHVTLDRTATGTRPGGAAYYAALAAHRLGLRPGLVTSFGPDFPGAELPRGLAVANVPSVRTTTFQLSESVTGRQLRLLSRAADLEEDHLPAEWRGAPLALLCPVANEVDPLLAAGFPEASLGVLPQGWMRGRGAGGAITREAWEDALTVLPYVQSLVVSVEEVEPFKEIAAEWFEQVPLAAVTRGRLGAILFVNGEPYHVEPDEAVEVDATGAGDVFAAVFLVEYHRLGDPWEAAAAAACAAAASVEAPGAAAIPDRQALERRLAAYRRRRGG